MINEYPIDTTLGSLELYQKIRKYYSNSVLLESLEGPEKLATQSIICFGPVAMYEVSDNRLWEGTIVLAKGLEEIKYHLISILTHYNPNQNTGYTQQFRGGLLGFVSYDFIRYIESIGQKNTPEVFPDAYWGLYLDGIVFDHVKNKVIYFHHRDYPSRYKDVLKICDRKVDDESRIEFGDMRFHTTPEEFEQWVMRIKEHIRRGETFQTVISQRASFTARGDHFLLYKRLRAVNPSPYMYYLDFDPYCVIGSSPELLVSVVNGMITTYPIAGTRPLGETPAEKKAYRTDLRNDEKERAEHNMLVDLARNDVGKVSTIGSVQVPEYMEIEEFSHVIHLVSKVTGKIKDESTLLDAFIATFPAGTVSGAPKIRSMAIINTIEQRNRGPYAGSVGYFGIFNDMVQAITIRSAFGRYDDFVIQAGAGIVLDSIPSKEYQETLDKLAAFLDIIQ